MDKNNAGFGAGVIGGVLLFVFILNVIYTEPYGFRPSWLNQVTFWTIALFVLGFVWHSFIESKKQRKHQEWLLSLTEKERESYFRGASRGDDDAGRS